MAQSTYIPRIGHDADFANLTASGTLAVTGATTVTGALSAGSVTGPVPLVTQAAGNFTLSAATHANKITLVNDADAVITLPAASGTGNVYKVLYVTTASTSGTIVGLTNAATFLGGVVAIDTDAGADSRAWGAASGNNTFTCGTATGGKVGDWVSFTDVATNLYLVDGVIKQSGGSEATPFSTAA
jgi:hypothetical protein